MSHSKWQLIANTCNIQHHAILATSHVLSTERHDHYIAVCLAGNHAPSMTLGIHVTPIHHFLRLAFKSLTRQLLHASVQRHNLSQWLNAANDPQQQWRSVLKV